MSMWETTGYPGAPFSLRCRIPHDGRKFDAASNLVGAAVEIVCARMDPAVRRRSRSFNDDEHP